jgi:NAD-dependent SIR2 family protein deacetylase
MRTVPTESHMALLQLMNYQFNEVSHMPPDLIVDESQEKCSILKFIISQNIDGLHRRSGVPRHRIAELHGNTNLEVCRICGTDYNRDYPTRTKT